MSGIEDTIGNSLKKERLKRGLSYDEAYEDLKIQPKILRALEEDEELDIGDIYIRKFVKKYADFLGFEGDKVLSDFMSKHSLYLSDI